MNKVENVNIKFCFDRCVHWIEEKSKPPKKKDEIVREILSELNKVETGQGGPKMDQPGYPHPPESTSGYTTPHTGPHMAPGVSNLERRPSLERSSQYEGGYERQSGYGRPAISNSLLEERQRSIVRQLDR